MQQLTPQGHDIINGLAQRYGLSYDAVLTMLNAVINGGGTMAQFSHPELGGSGQWMQGGMTMVGDMFNYGIKSKVNGLCSELSNLLASSQNMFEAPAQPSVNDNWWRADLGSPSSSGGQNNTRYAYFPSSHRLAVDVNGDVSIYDTLDHQIGGVSQQQGGNNSMTFSSQYGSFSTLNLPLISVNGQAPVAPEPVYNPPVNPPANTQTPYVEPVQNQNQNAAPQNTTDSNDVFRIIEQLAELRKKDILTEDEFSTKKAELLSRLS